MKARIKEHSKIYRKAKELSVMNRAIKYRIYPTKEQVVMFAKTFGCCRKVYNLMLESKIESYEKTGEFARVTPAMYKNEHPYLKEVDSLALANVQMNLEGAFRSCFDKKRKKRNGFPKFKSAKRSKRSYTTNNQKGSVAIIGNSIKLPKIGKVKAVIHREPDAEWVLKSATISQEKDGKYYVSVLFEFEGAVSSQVIDKTNAIGLDYASDGLYVDDKGNIGSNHKYYRESYKKLCRAQRKLSRMIEKNISGYKVVGNKRTPIYIRPLSECKNIQKHILVVAGIHKHVANQRLDSLHKKSTEIANQYDVVCVESLNMKSLANKGFKNGKATYDNGYGMFLNMLEYKLSDRGKILIKVDKWFPSSQICHHCGKQNSEMKDLNKRDFVCECGYTNDRDVNAALNIKREGLRLLAL